MKFNILQPHSLKTRVTLFTLGIFVSSIWALSFYASEMLRKDMQRLLGEQQFSTVSILAAEVNKQLDDRFLALQTVAGSITPAMMGNPASLPRLLEARPLLQSLFNADIFITQLDGTAVANIPLSTKRIGSNFMDHDVIAAALREGKSTVGRPILSNKLKAPLIYMAVPILNAQGKVIGAIAGVTNLEQQNFLAQITASRYGQSGGYILVARAHRLVITAADKSRIMQPLPAPGINPAIDRFINGYEGYAIYANQFGVEVLTSSKLIPAADWGLGASLPTAEAFAPIRDMQQRMLFATIFLTLLAGGLTWWMLRRQLLPMLDTARILASLAESSGPIQSLPITRHDEIGEMIGGFNRLLDSLAQRDVALQQHNEILRNILETSLDGFWRVDNQGRLIEVNPTYCQQSGYSREELLVMAIPDIEANESAVETARHIRKIIETGRHQFESRHRRKDGSIWDVEVSATYLNVAGGLICAFLRDITARKQAESDLRIAAAAFDSHEGMMVTDANSVILRVNQALTEITGYSAVELVGKTPRILQSGRHDQEFYRAMWKTIRSTGGWQGEIWDQRKNGEMYPKWLTISVVKDEQGVVTHYVSAQFDITERKNAEDRINALAFFDALTGLPNRFSLHERLKQALGLAERNGKQLAVMLIDLDNFKIINDTLGHSAGDQLLIQVAQRLSDSARQSDLVARLGGDEFVIILPDIDSPTDAANVAEKILTMLSAAYPIDGHELRTSPSIGICLYPDDATRSEELIKKADVAMYHAKSNGKNNYQFFRDEIQAATLKRIALEAELRKALEQQQLALYYQPQLDLRTGHLSGVEALVRWQHPERGLVPPIDFIPIAEETGLIIPLGDWVLKQACQQMATWHANGLDHLKISVNLAASQFADQRLPARIAEILAQTGLPASSLDLEVTESMTMKSPEETATMMRVLTGQGLSLSIDDFGTGYSSLSYLKTFPISTLKIDRSFVKDIETDQNDADICSVTVLLAHKLGLDVVAEGVETEAQLRYLHSVGCEKIQGYLISKPLPADKAEEFIRNNPIIERTWHD